MAITNTKNQHGLYHMTYDDVLIAGFGGQGVLLAGKLLAWAGMLDGLHVTWFPSYGAEMRGGTANCTVVMSKEEIGSPVVDSPHVLVAFNQASVDKFMARVKRGGLVILNSSLVIKEPSRAGVRVIRVPANDIAAELGDVRVANMVMLGAYIKATGNVGMVSVARALEQALPARRKGLAAMNMTALKRGGSEAGND